MNIFEHCLNRGDSTDWSHRCFVCILYGASTRVCMLSVEIIVCCLLGMWIKPSRWSRMREKRADFVAGCLGGRVIAAGGLGQRL